jgi:hypothetical protein
MEIWKDIPGYENLYQINSIGDIKSLSRNRNKILNKFINKKGYYMAFLYKDGIRKSISYHQLMAITFLNHEVCGMKLVVNHKNAIRTDNRIENLEIVTNRVNCMNRNIIKSSKYTGVSLDKRSKKWRSGIRINGKRIELGKFDNELDAHNEYLKALNNL